MTIPDLMRTENRSGPSRSRESASRRYGFTILEMIGACTVLGVVFSLTVPMLLIIARERQSAEQRQFALQHVTNLLEKVTARSWSELSPGNQELPAAEADLSVVLPGMERTLMINQIDDDIVSRQIVASIRWKNYAGQLVAPIQVAAWVYPPSEVP